MQIVQADRHLARETFILQTTMNIKVQTNDLLN